MLDDPGREAWLPTPTLLGTLDAPPDSVVLDFGTGTGRYALALAKERPDLHVVAYDVQPEMVEIVGTRAHEQQLDMLDATDDSSSLRPRAFDRILVVNVLHEIGDVEVARIASLVRPSGMALFVDWDGGVEREVGPPGDHVHSKAEAIERLARLGFASVRDLGMREMPNHYVLAAHPAEVVA